MNNSNYLPAPNSKDLTEQTFIDSNALNKTLSQDPSGIKVKIRQSKQTDAKLFSTYKPVNQKSITPVHQLLF